MFVLVNGFFVAAEFGLVKARAARIRAMAEHGSSSAQMVLRINERLDLYLSACQLGITVASLILGWLAEPAIARLLVAVANNIGIPLAYGAMVHGISLAIALILVTIMHMTVGEQAPKILAIHRPEQLAMKTAHPLYLFTLVFRPLIWFINKISNALLRTVGIRSGASHEGPMSAIELKEMLAVSAQAGQITTRQQTFADNILSLIDFEVRHILVPRVDIVELSLARSAAENIKIIRESKHSRFPLCDGDLDKVVGIVHAKDIFRAPEETPELRALARSAVFVPDTQPLGRMIVELQRAQKHCAIVLDDHGTAIGMAFLEDAIEEIVGPIYDEFDEGVPPPEPTPPSEGVFELPGNTPTPEAASLLGFSPDDEEDDTIGGHVVSRLGRLPRLDDKLTLGGYRATVIEVEKNRIVRLRFDPVDGDERTEN